MGAPNNDALVPWIEKLSLIFGTYNRAQADPEPWDVASGYDRRDDGVGKAARLGGPTIPQVGWNPAKGSHPDGVLLFGEQPAAELGTGDVVGGVLRQWDPASNTVSTVLNLQGLYASKEVEVRAPFYSSSTGTVFVGVFAVSVGEDADGYVYELNASTYATIRTRTIAGYSPIGVFEAPSDPGYAYVLAKGRGGSSAIKLWRWSITATTWSTSDAAVYTSGAFAAGQGNVVERSGRLWWFAGGSLLSRPVPYSALDSNLSAGSPAPDRAERHYPHPSESDLVVAGHAADQNRVVRTYRYKSSGSIEVYYVPASNHSDDLSDPVSEQADTRPPLAWSGATTHQATPFYDSLGVLYVFLYTNGASGSAGLFQIDREPWRVGLRELALPGGRIA